MDADQWEDLNELVCSMIMLSMSKSVYFNVKDTEGGPYAVWQNYAICMTSRVR